MGRFGRKKKEQVSNRFVFHFGSVVKVGILYVMGSRNLRCETLSERIAYDTHRREPCLG